MISLWNLFTAADIAHRKRAVNGCPGQMKCTIHPIGGKQTSASLLDICTYTIICSNSLLRVGRSLSVVRQIFLPPAINYQDSNPQRASARFQIVDRGTLPMGLSRCNAESLIIVSREFGVSRFMHVLFRKRVEEYSCYKRLYFLSISNIPYFFSGTQKLLSRLSNSFLISKYFFYTLLNLFLS